MRKAVVLTLLAFSSLAFARDDNIELNLIKDRIERVEFLAKESSAVGSELKSAIDEINTQLAKQNEINKKLAEKIVELQDKIKELEQKQEIKQQETKKEVKQEVVGYSKVNDLAVRKKPNYKPENVIALLKKGTKVEIVGKEGIFYKIRFLDGEYYVSAKYVEVER